MILWAAVILSASNDSFSAQQSGSWLRSLFGRDLPLALHALVRKAGHVFEYSVLALLAWRAHRTIPVPLVIVFLVAFLDEWIQSRTLARTGTPWDVVLDVCVGTVVVALLQATGPRSAGAPAG